MRFFILDEADRLLDTGNKHAILQMFRSFPKLGVGANRLQVLLFSATLHSPEVTELAQQICQNPILVDLKGKDSVPETVDHVLVRVDPSKDRTWIAQRSMVRLILNNNECNCAISLWNEFCIHFCILYLVLECSLLVIYGPRRFNGIFWFVGSDR